MSRFSWISLLMSPAMLAVILSAAPSAQAVEGTTSASELEPQVEETSDTVLLLPQTVAGMPPEAQPTATVASSPESESRPALEMAQLNSYSNPNVADLAGDRSAETMAQVTSVSQLSDVQPTDWAFQALQSLVERYGVIAGYPDGTFRGNRAMTRYEFAAGLNAALDRINELINAGTGGLVSKEDLETLQRLQEEFSAELATLRGRVDALEARTAELEANQFSTTTKLSGEVIFTVADAFGDEVDAETVLHDRVRLNFLTSFTGKDLLITRLQAGNVGPSFRNFTGTDEGRFTYDGFVDNDVRLDRLHYIFPVTDNLKATIMANAGGHHFYADTVNPYLESGGGGTGSLSRFGERNPIYRQGLGGVGAGFNYNFGKSLRLDLGYLATEGSDPSPGDGLFNGGYSALAQLVFQPTSRLKVGLTYLNSYDSEADRRFNYGGTGTEFGNLRLRPLGITNTPVSSNSYGVEASFRLSSNFLIGGWFGYTTARLIGFGDADLLNYAVTLTFPDLGKKGNLGAIIVGAEPYLTNLDVPGEPNFEEETPFHIEAFYKYQLTDNIAITPGVIWLTSPNQSENTEDIVIGAVRTTFTF